MSLPAGTYSSVTVTGFCGVNAGVVTVTGNVTVRPGAALIAAFGKNDMTHSGTSSITVNGNVTTGSGSSLVLGCEPQAFSCFDDPNANTPSASYSSSDKVGGNVSTPGALGVIVHNSKIAGDVSEARGGPGVTCNGNFLGSGFGAYSDYEDNAIGGNLWITGIQTCWLGAIRDKVAGSITVSHNTMADPDATEILTNAVTGNLICLGNKPAAQYGDSHGVPNRVAGSAAGECAFSVRQADPAPEPAMHGNPAVAAGPVMPISVANNAAQGYDLVGGDGGVFAFGTAFYGSAPGTAEILPYVGIASSPGGHGYWIANGTGRIVGFGHNAPSFGDAAALILAKPIVGVAAAAGGDGYYLAAGDGGVFNYGPGTHFYGSAGALPLAKPVCGLAAAAGGNGYTLVANDGGVFNYGPGSKFHGSAATLHLAAPIVGIAIDPVTGGYWLVGSDGGVFSYGAPFFGSAAPFHPAQPVVGIVAAPHGDGYYLVAKDGGVFAFGPGVHFQGSTGGIHLSKPVSGMALG